MKEISEDEARLNILPNAWLDPSIPPQQLALVTQELDSWIQESKPMMLFDTLRTCMTRIDMRSKGQPKVLEVGCGAGHNSVVVDRAGAFQYLGIDYNPKFIELAIKNFAFNKPNINFRVMDALQINFPSQYFDVVLHSACLMHIHNWRAALDVASHKTNRYLVLHRNPISMKHRTRYFLKDAYGVQCLEIWLSEHDLFGAGGLVGFTLREMWETSRNLDCAYRTYLFERK